MKNETYRSVLVWLLGGALAGHAQTYNFDDGTLTDTTGQTTLQPYNLFGSGQLPPPASGSLHVVNGELRMEASHFGMGTSENPALLGTILGPTRIAAFNPVPYEDFRVAVDIPHQGAGGSVEGRPFYLLGARVSNPGPGRTSGYAAQFGPSSQGAALSILRVENEALTSLAGGGGFEGIWVPDWSPEKSYRLVFTGRGPVLSAKIYELGDPIKLLFTWSVTDPTFQAGITGVLVGASTFSGPEIAEQSISGTLDNFTSEAAPALESPPPLDIAQSVMLAWPVPEGSFRLESSRQVGGPWVPVHDTPIEVDGQLRLSLLIVEGRSFFRLATTAGD